MIKQTTCAFTGHRDIIEDIDLAYFKEVMQGFIDEGYNTFLNGMARGFDMLAAKIIIELKQTNPSIKLIACIPCFEQERYYSQTDKRDYAEILSKCDEKVYVSERFYKGCMQKRDRYLVDNCSLLVAYERKNYGGTYYTLNYALSKKVKVCII